MDRYHFTSKMFSPDELCDLRKKFHYVDTDIKGRHRLFFDNAGGSLRLVSAEEAFRQASEMPDASEHSNELALELLAMEDKARADLKQVLFGAKSGVLYPSYTASAIIMDVIRIVSDHAHGSNYVTTVLEHPSSFDAMTLNASKHGCELRIAQADPESGGVSTDAILSLIDENTAILSCMAASNISGAIYDLPAICKGARQINPDIFIICDAVQHAPHAVLDPESLGVDMMHFAPYKFFGVRGFAVAWLSDRIAEFEHSRLLGKSANDWEIGSPATAQFAAVQQIMEYVIALGKKTLSDETDRRSLYISGMTRIADHERGLLYLLLEGTENVPGLRHMKGVTVQMDGKDLYKRDLILGIEFDGLSCTSVVHEYDKRGIVTFDRSASSLYSRRMLDAFGLKGVVRLSPLHVNSPQDIEEFLHITEELATL